MERLSDVVVVAACRTAMGKFGGSLRHIPSWQLGAFVVEEVLKRANIHGNEVNEVILGSCRQAGNGPNPARTASVNGGVPSNIPSYTLNMACPSGMKAVNLAAQQIAADPSAIVIAGGFENMSSIPYLLKNARWEGFKMGNQVLEDGWSDSIDPLIGMGMGETAENLVEKHQISRHDQDLFAAESHRKAALAASSGYFDAEIVPLTIAVKNAEPRIFNADETIRPHVSLDDMAKLKPSFRKEGSVTAGNACGLSDGAAALLMMHRHQAEKKGGKPLFSIIGYAQTAVDPQTMGEGPAYSIPLALQQAGLSIHDIDLFEINEAFAVQVLCNQRVLGIPDHKLNIHGGAIALGHPTGISGARILVTAYYALRQTGGTYAVAAICGGGGVTTAMVIKRES